MLGRFLGRDSIEEKGGLHLYAFCQNNAVNSWDHLGMYLDVNLSQAQLAAYAAGYAKDPSAYTMTPDQYAANYNYQMSRLQTNSCGPSCGSGGFMNGAFANEYGGGGAIGASIDEGNAQSAQLTMIANADKPKTEVIVNPKDGKTYVVTTNLNAAVPSGSEGYIASVGGGAPVGISSIGQMVSLGTVGNESDPVNVANAPGPSYMENLTSSQISSMASNMAATNTYYRNQANGGSAVYSELSSYSGAFKTWATAGEIVGSVPTIIYGGAALPGALGNLGEEAISTGVQVINAGRNASNSALLLASLQSTQVSTTLVAQEWLVQNAMQQVMIQSLAEGLSPEAAAAAEVAAAEAAFAAQQLSAAAANH